MDKCWRCGGLPNRCVCTVSTDDENAREEAVHQILYEVVDHGDLGEPEDLEKYSGSQQREEPCAFLEGFSGGTEDKVNDPTHYTKGIEVLQFVESHNLNFSQGNAVKYIVRCDHKGKKAEDLAKALFYVAFELEKAGGQEALTKFSKRWLNQETMLTKTYLLEKSRNE